MYEGREGVPAEVECSYGECKYRRTLSTNSGMVRAIDGCSRLPRERYHPSSVIKLWKPVPSLREAAPLTTSQAMCFVWNSGHRGGSPNRILERIACFGREPPSGKLRSLQKACEKLAGQERVQEDSARTLEVRPTPAGRGCGRGARGRWSTSAPGRGRRRLRPNPCGTPGP